MRLLDELQKALSFYYFFVSLPPINISRILTRNKMRKNYKAIKIMLLAYLAIIPFTSTAMSIDEQKDVLKRIWIIQTTMDNLYTAPADYTFDASTGNITSKSFYSFTQWQFNTINIDFSNPNAIKASFQHSGSEVDNLQLEIENNKLVSLQQSSRVTGRDGIFRIQQENNGNYIVIREHRTNSGRSIVEMNDGQIVSIRSYRLNNRNREFHFFTITFTYSNNQVITNQVFHATLQGGRPTQSTRSRVFEVRSENNVFKSLNDNSREYFYNPYGRLIRRIIDNNRGLIVDSTYEYIDDELAKSISITTGTRYEKDIRIYIEQPDADRSRPDYEWRQGIYRFENGILVREIRDGLFRTKTDGVWSEWRHARM